MPAIRILIPFEREAQKSYGKAWHKLTLGHVHTQAYSSFLATPLDVAHSILKKLQQSEARDPPMSFLASQDPEDLLGQARAATIRHVHSKSLLILNKALNLLLSPLALVIFRGDSWLEQTVI